MDRFHKVSRREPCPVCGHADWCVVSNDGGTCICFRTESDRPHDKGGWVHVLKRTLPVRHDFAPVRRPPRPQMIDMERVMQGFRREFAQTHALDGDHDAMFYLSEDVLLSPSALERLTPGRSEFYNAWAFPMRDGGGKVVGVRLREYVSGRKWSVAGSKDGLFYDPGLEAAETVSRGVRGREIVIVEGATDCAAGYEIGLATVGRSSCNTGVEQLQRLCDRLRVGRVTIVTDNDRFKERVTRTAKGAPTRTVWRPGIEGAERLARDLGRMYRLVTPPKKDLREWLYSGLTAETFQTVVDAQRWRMPQK